MSNSSDSPTPSQPLVSQVIEEKREYGDTQKLDIKQIAQVASLEESKKNPPVDQSIAMDMEQVHGFAQDAEWLSGHSDDAFDELLIDSLDEVDSDYGLAELVSVTDGLMESVDTPSSPPPAIGEEEVIELEDLGGMIEEEPGSSPPPLQLTSLPPGRPMTGGVAPPQAPPKFDELESLDSDMEGLLDDDALDEVVAQAFSDSLYLDLASGSEPITGADPITDDVEAAESGSIDEVASRVFAIAEMEPAHEKRSEILAPIGIPALWAERRERNRNRPAAEIMRPATMAVAAGPQTGIAAHFKELQVPPVPRHVAVELLNELSHLTQDLQRNARHFASEAIRLSPLPDADEFALLFDTEAAEIDPLAVDSQRSLVCDAWRQDDWNRVVDGLGRFATQLEELSQRAERWRTGLPALYSLLGLVLESRLKRAADAAPIVQHALETSESTNVGHINALRYAYARGANPSRELRYLQGYLAEPIPTLIGYSELWRTWREEGARKVRPEVEALAEDEISTLAFQQIHALVSENTNDIISLGLKLGAALAAKASQGKDTECAARASAHYIQCANLSRQKDLQAALNALEEAIQVDPNPLLPAYHLEQWSRASGDQEKVIEALQVTLRHANRGPRQVVSMSLLAPLLLQQGKAQEALKLLKQAHHINPKWAPLQRAILFMAGKLGQLPKHLTYIQDRLLAAELIEASAPEKAFADYLQVIEVKPEDELAQRGLLRHAVATKDFSQVYPYFRRDPAISAPLAFICKYELNSLGDAPLQRVAAAEKALCQQDFKTALNLWASLPIDGSESAESWQQRLREIAESEFQLQDALLKIGDDAAFTLAQDSDPSSPELLKSALFAAKNGDAENAKARALSYIEASPNDIGALDLLATIALDQGDWQSLIDTLIRRTQLCPPEGAGALLLHAAQLTADQIRDLDGAAQLARQVLQINPREPGALRLLELQLWRDKVWPELTQELGLAAQVDSPHGARAAVELAYIQYRNGALTKPSVAGHEALLPILTWQRRLAWRAGDSAAALSAYRAIAHHSQDPCTFTAAALYAQALGEAPEKWLQALVDNPRVGESKIQRYIASQIAQVPSPKLLLQALDRISPTNISDNILLTLWRVRALWQDKQGQTIELLQRLPEEDQELITVCLYRAKASAKLQDHQRCAAELAELARKLPPCPIAACLLQSAAEYIQGQNPQGAAQLLQEAQALPRDPRLPERLDLFAHADYELILNAILELPINRLDLGLFTIELALLYEAEKGANYDSYSHWFQALRSLPEAALARAALANYAFSSTLQANELELTRLYLAGLSLAKESASAWFEEALFALAKNDAQSAETALNEVLVLQPSNPEALALLAEISCFGERPDEAATWLLESARNTLCPSLRAARYYEAGLLLLLELDQVDQAIATFNLAIEADEQHLPSIAAAARLADDNENWAALLRLRLLEAEVDLSETQPLIDALRIVSRHFCSLDMARGIADRLSHGPELADALVLVVELGRSLQIPTPLELDELATQLPPYERSFFLWLNALSSEEIATKEQLLELLLQDYPEHIPAQVENTALQAALDTHASSSSFALDLFEASLLARMNGHHALSQQIIDRHLPHLGAPADVWLLLLKYAYALIDEDPISLNILGETLLDSNCPLPPAIKQAAALRYGATLGLDNPKALPLWSKLFSNQPHNPLLTEIFAQACSLHQPEECAPVYIEHLNALKNQHPRSESKLQWWLAHRLISWNQPQLITQLDLASPPSSQRFWATSLPLIAAQDEKINPSILGPQASYDDKLAFNLLWPQRALLESLLRDQNEDAYFALALMLGNFAHINGEIERDLLSRLIPIEQDPDYADLLAYRIAELLANSEPQNALDVFAEVSVVPSAELATERTAVLLGSHGQAAHFLFGLLKSTRSRIVAEELLYRLWCLCPQDRLDELFQLWRHVLPHHSLPALREFRDGAAQGDLFRVANSMHQLAESCQASQSQELFLEAALIYGFAASNEHALAENFLWALLEKQPGNEAIRVALLAQMRPSADLAAWAEVQETLAAHEEDNDTRATYFVTAAAAFSEVDQSHALKVLDRCLDSAPDDIIALKLQRILSIALMRPNEIATAAEREARLHPNKQIQVRLLLLAADTYQKTGNAEAASKLFLSILELEPENETAFTALDRLFARQGLRDRHHELLLKRAELVQDPTNRRDLLRRAASVAAEGQDADAAIQNLRDVVKLDPSDVLSLNKLAALCQQNGRWDEAIRNYEQIPRFTQSPELVIDAYKRALQLLDEKKQDHKRAINVAQKILNIQNNDVPTLYRLADLYEKTQRYNEVLSTLDRLLQTERDLALKRELLSRLINGQLRWFGDHQRAEQRVLDARELDPNDLSFIEKVASWYREKGMKNERDRFLSVHFDYYRNRYATDPSTATLHHLFQITRGWIPDRAFVAAGLLHAKGRTNEVEAATYARGARVAIDLPAPALSVVALNSVVSQGVSPGVIEIMRAAEPHIARVSPHTLAFKSLSWRQRVKPSSSPQIAILAGHAHAFGVELPTVYVLPERQRVPFFAIGKESAIILEEKDLDEQNFPATRLLVASCASAMALRVGLFCALSFNDSYKLFLAVIKAVLPQAEIDDDPNLAKRAEAVSRVLPKQIRQALLPWIAQDAEKLNENHLKIEIQALQLTILRQALLSVRDISGINRAVNTFANDGRLPVRGALTDLHRFLLSDHFQQLRFDNRLAVM